MSGFVFEWLPVSGGMILSRRLHLFASHWGLILMSLHTGMHWGMVVRLGTKFRKKSESEDGLTWLARAWQPQFPYSVSMLLYSRTCQTICS